MATWKARKTSISNQNATQRCGVVYCLMYYITDDRKKIFNIKRFMPDETDLYRKGLMYMFRGIGMPSCLFRREVFDKYGYFVENIKGWGEDVELLLRVSRDYKFFCINEPLVNYYKTKDSLSKDYGKALESAFYIFRKYYDDIKRDWGILAIHYSRLSKQLKKVGKRKMSKQYRMKAWFFNILNKFRVY